MKEIRNIAKEMNMLNKISDDISLTYEQYYDLIEVIESLRLVAEKFKDNGVVREKV